MDKKEELECLDLAFQKAVQDGTNDPEEPLDFQKEREKQQYLNLEKAIAEKLEEHYESLSSEEQTLFYWRFSSRIAQSYQEEVLKLASRLEACEKQMKEWKKSLNELFPVLRVLVAELKKEGITGEEQP